jgi:hypothetical protein
MSPLRSLTLSRHRRQVGFRPKRDPPPMRSLAGWRGGLRSANVALLRIHRYGRSAMARAKQASKRSRSRKALPVWGAAGMSLAMASGASAAVVPGEKAPSQARLPVITLGEEELSDVSLSKFFVYDREATASSRLGVQYAQRCGGGRGCGGGCRGCGGAGRCGGGGCAVARCARCGGGCAVRRCGVGCGVGIGCAACSCSCCISWGACQLC